MATAEQIALTRAYTDEPDESNWTDVELGALIDDVGSVESAAARVWVEKQARYSKLVDVAEAGASRKMSQAYEHAKEMAAHWLSISGEAADTSLHAKVHKIVRS